MAFDEIGALFAMIILFAYTVQTITGFGSTVIALSLGIMFYSIDEILPFLVFSNILFAGVLVAKFHEGFNKQLAFKIILPGTFIGMILGYGLKPMLDESLLKSLLGFLVISISVMELKVFFVRSNIESENGKTENRPDNFKMKLLTLLSGLSHGIFASGGPLLVYAVAKFRTNKTQFRATVLVCLFSLNIVLAFLFLIDGRLQPVMPFVMAAIPIMYVAIKLGSYLHSKVNEILFKKSVYALLFLMGINLVTQGYVLDT